METISYNSVISVAQGPTLTSKGEIKTDASSRITVTLTSGGQKELKILPSPTTKVDLLCIRANKYPALGSPTISYKVGSSSDKQNQSSSPKIQMYNDHLYITSSVVQLLGQHLNDITFWNETDYVVEIEILTGYEV